MLNKYRLWCERNDVDNIERVVYLAVIVLFAVWLVAQVIRVLL
jgi:hypothetical protein